jgi:hypothetical protein
MSKPQRRCYFYRHFILKVTSMISDNITRDTKPGDNLVEHKEGCSLPIGFYGRHGLDPLSNVGDDHNNVLIPPNRSWVAIDEIYPPLGEGTDGNDWVKRGWMQAHFLSEHLARVTLPNRFDTIFKDSGLEITGSQDFLGYRKPR